MNQGSFAHNVDPIVLTEVAAQTGTNTLIVHLPGGAIVQQDFTSTIGVAFSIPNIFPESGSFRFEIIQPDGAAFDDASACSMTLDVLLLSCAV
jgi:hypothetical protein